MYPKEEIRRVPQRVLRDLAEPLGIGAQQGEVLGPGAARTGSGPVQCIMAAPYAYMCIYIYIKRNRNSYKNSFFFWKIW